MLLLDQRSDADTKINRAAMCKRLDKLLLSRLTRISVSQIYSYESYAIFNFNVFAYIRCLCIFSFLLGINAHSQQSVISMNSISISYRCTFGFLYMYIIREFMRHQ